MRKTTSVKTKATKIPKSSIMDVQVEQKALPPNFGSFESLIISPRTIQNDAPSIIRLNTGWTNICIEKVASTLISLPLHCYVVMDDDSQKCAWKTKKLSKSEQTLIKQRSPSLKIKQAQNIEEIEEHKIFEVLNNVNDDLNWDDLVKLVIQYLMLIGNAFIEVKKENGIPVGIEVLPAEYTSVMLDKDTMALNGYRIYNGVMERLTNVEDTIHFKKVAPGMFWRIYGNQLLTGVYGMGPVESILSPIMLMNAIDDYERALIENMCIPSGIVKYTQGNLTPDALKAAEASWRKAVGGIKRAGAIKVTDQNWEFTNLSINPKDLNFKDGRHWLREIICNAIGVPVGLISPTDSNRSTSQTDLSNYLRFTIAPLAKLITRRLNTHFIPMFDDNMFVEFDNPVKDDNDFLMKNTDMKLKNGLITINEWRAEEGLEDVPWGDAPMGNVSTTNRNDPNSTNTEQPNPNELTNPDESPKPNDNESPEKQ